MVQIKCEGMVVTGQTEVKVCEGLQNLHADAVIIGTRDRGTLARYKCYPVMLQSNIVSDCMQRMEMTNIIRSNIKELMELHSDKPWCSRLIFEWQDLSWKCE
jgi:hypothetical protein